MSFARPFVMLPQQSQESIIEPTVRWINVTNYPFGQFSIAYNAVLIYFISLALSTGI